MKVRACVNELGQADLAIPKFRSAIEIDAAVPNGHLWLGIALASRKNFQDALIALTKANDLTKGHSAEVHWQLARVYKDLERFDRSADELELFLKYDPQAKNADEIKKVIQSLRRKK